MTNTLKTSGYWAEFPVTYRAEQVAEIMRWVTAGESGVVVGGSGTGKFNLTGFLSSRPDAVAPHLADNVERYYPMCNSFLDLTSKNALVTLFIKRFGTKSSV